MSGFDLVPEDGGDPIHLPPGETVLGRGPFLRVSDKRVSRQHGLLENLNGQLRLKPTHLNPCFVQSSPTEDPRPLQRDSWHPLRHGDLISLLPGQLIYRVAAVGGGDHTPRYLCVVLMLRVNIKTRLSSAAVSPDVSVNNSIRTEEAALLYQTDGKGHSSSAQTSSCKIHPETAASFHKFWFLTLFT
uniref:Aprataxin and PNKP like factor n=1 Tax=Dicentrarchus labrax TaxID=13489 RepID=A0A8P4JXR6_DICLA